MIPASAQTLIGRFPLGIVASVTPEGVPAASPKGTFLVLDEGRIAFGDIRSPGTLANLRTTPMLEVVFVDPFTRKGVRIAGATTTLSAGSAEFATLIPRWHAVWGDLAGRIRALVLIDVTRCLPLSTPPYDDGATEDEMIATYKAKYAEFYP